VSAPATLEALLDLYDRFGDRCYGERVTQTSHALQCAARAAADGAAAPLVAAALLHDVGHLLVAEGSDVTATDDRHEATGARVLAAILGRDVARPVSLHVAAKRWRCAVDPDYLARLSDASRASLARQGGPFEPAACRRFASHPGFRDAVALRGWDDDGKAPDQPTGSVRDHAPLLARLAARRGP
jgi:predicted HD phosphohydrolase